MTWMTRRAPSGVVALLPMLAMLAAPGCARYKRRPLDAEAMITAWQRRTPTDLRVAAHAKQHGQPFDVRDGVSIDEAALVARAVHPRVHLARAKAGVATANRTAAGRWPDPRISGTARKITSAVPQAWLLDWTLSVQIPLSDRYGAENARAEAAATAAGHEADLRAWQVELALRRAWLRWSAAKQREAAMARHVRAFRPLLAGARERARVGELDTARIGVVEVAFLDVEQRSTRAAMETRLARRVVLRAMGLRPTAPVALVPLPAVVLPASARPAVLAGSNPVDPSAAGPDDASRIRRRHPALLAARARYNQAEQRLRRAIARQWPTLSIGPSLERSDSGLALGLGVGLPISLVTGSFRAIATARANRVLVGHQLTWTLERLLADASDARARTRLAEQQLAAVRAKLIPAVDALLERLTRLAAIGEIDVLLVQAALNRARLARLVEIDAGLDVGLARLALQAALDAPLPLRTGASASKEARR